MLLARAVVFTVCSLAGIGSFIGIAPFNPSAAVAVCLLWWLAGAVINAYMPD
jgi:hypothetical protein